MRTVKLNDADDSLELAKEVADVIGAGGLACLPCGGRYRIVADLLNPKAVTQLLQAKSRIKTAPALAFVRGEEMLPRITQEMDPLARQIAVTMWPQLLTIRITPDALPSKVVKQLGGKKTRLGVRMPSESLLLDVMRLADSPLLVSSANRERKHGESSPAQVRKTFGARLNLFLDGGDLQPGLISTVIDIVDAKVVVERQGTIDSDTIAASLLST
jgi:L-threonylcarbamoyladenylate synthase